MNCLNAHVLHSVALLASFYMYIDICSTSLRSQAYLLIRSPVKSSVTTKVRYVAVRLIYYNYAALILREYLIGRVRLIHVCLHFKDDFCVSGTHYWTRGQNARIGGVRVAYYIASLDHITQNIYVVSSTCSYFYCAV